MSGNHEIAGIARSRIPGLRRWMLLVVAALVVAVSLVPLQPAAAQSQASAAALFATVLEVRPPDTLVVVNDAGSQTLRIGPDTILRIGSSPASIEQVLPGDRAVASVEQQDDGSYLGVSVLIVPANSPAVTKHLVGVIVESAPGQVGLRDRAGNLISLDIPDGIDVPEIGEVVTVVATLDPVTRHLLIKSFEVASETVERIKEAADAATDAEEVKRLRTALEEARRKHLSALEDARRAIENARTRLEEAEEQAEAARKLVAELQAKLDALSNQYRDDAEERGDAAPQATVKGAWVMSTTSSFTLDTPDGLVEISYDSNTRAAGTAINAAGRELFIAGTDGDVASVAFLSDVAPDVPDGANAVVFFELGNPPLARLAVFVQPELPQALLDEIAARAKGLFVGVITLVEETPGLPGASGVVGVADMQSGRKAFARVTEATEITIDGLAGGIEGLAAGQQAEVIFDEELVNAAGGASAAAARGLLDAIAIRAWTETDPDESHLSGVIKNIVPVERKLLITPAEGPDLEAVVAAEAPIEKDGAEALFTDLAVGDLILGATRYIESQHTFSRLVLRSARELRFSGLITGLETVVIDRADVEVPQPYSALKLTLTIDDGAALTVYVTQETDLRSLTNGDIRPSDLAVGDLVVDGKMQTVTRAGRVLNLARKMVIGESDVETLRGIVVSVSEATGALVIASRDSARVELLVRTLLPANSVFKNDQPVTTLGEIVAGDIVEYAAYETGTFHLIKLYVLSAGLLRVNGEVLEVDIAAGIVVVQSRVAGEVRAVVLSVTRTTALVLNRRAIESLELINAGDILANALYYPGEERETAGEAVFMYFLSQPGSEGSRTPDSSGSEPERPAVETVVTGPIESIEGNVMVVDGQKFTTNSDTQYFGEKPEVGLVARAVLVSHEHGAFIAVAVSVSGSPSSNPSDKPVDVRPVDPFTIPSGPDGSTQVAIWVTGVVEKVDGENLVIGRVAFALTSDTLVTGKPEVGATARALLLRRKDGTTVALQLIVESAATISRPTIAPVIVSVDPDGQTPVREKLVAKIDEIEGRVWRLAGRTLVVPSSVNVDVKAGSVVIVVVRRVSVAELRDALDEAAIRQLRVNLLYLTEVRGDRPVFLVEEVHVEQV